MLACLPACLAFLSFRSWVFPFSFPFLALARSFNPSPFLPFSSLMQAGLRDIAAGKKLLASLPPASFSSVFDHVQPPPPTTSSSTDQLVSAWESSVAKAQVAVEAQTLRSINVELATRYSVEQWKASVDSLAKAEEDAKTRVQRLQDETRKVQETRKATQERARGTLQTLGKRKYAAIASINGVAPAVAEAKHEAKRLKALAVQHGLVPEDYGDDEDADADGQIEAVSVI